MHAHSLTSKCYFINIYSGGFCLLSASLSCICLLLQLHFLMWAGIRTDDLPAERQQLHHLRHMLCTLQHAYNNCKPFNNTDDDDDVSAALSSVVTEISNYSKKIHQLSPEEAGVDPLCTVPHCCANLTHWSAELPSTAWILHLLLFKLTWFT